MMQSPPKKTSKSEEEASKADNEEFLAKLQNMCAEKTKAFEDRKMVRANEEAAVAEAVSILNSDEAFETFGAVKATTEGGTGPSLLQVSASRHTSSVREQVQKELTRVAQRSKSLKLAKIAVSLEVGNPFDKVIEELDAMVELIAKEEKADDEQKAWCDSEREESYAQLDDKNKLDAPVTAGPFCKSLGGKCWKVEKEEECENSLIVNLFCEAGPDEKDDEDDDPHEFSLIPTYEWPDIQ